MKEKETAVQDARRFRERAPRGFTLIELLVVITVIAVLMAVAAPTILGSVAASRLTSGGEILMGLFSDAQSRANSNNRPVEVRIYRVPTEEDELNGVTSGGNFRGVIFMEYYQPGEMDPRAAKNNSLVQLPRPLAIVRNSMHLLPGGIVISENPALSTLIANRPASMSGGGQTVEAVLKNGNNYESYSPPGTDYRAFIFYPEGTDLADGAKWHLTVTAQDEVDNAPNELRNFYTLQVDPLTGRLTSYRPSIQ